jgi:hypothetical protein
LKNFLSFLFLLPCPYNYFFGAQQKLGKKHSLLSIKITHFHLKINEKMRKNSKKAKKFLLELYNLREIKSIRCLLAASF